MPQATVAQDGATMLPADEIVPDPRWMSALRDACLVLSLAILILFIDRGFDFTDESYYLAWTIDPTRYAASIHPFGLPQHLLYEALDRSIIAFRAAGIVALLAAGTTLGWYLGDHYDETKRTRRSDWMLSSALFALAYYAYWGSTPNYNLMADVSAAMIVAGALGWLSRQRSLARTLSASLLIGVGGCLAFFAKPTSAGIMAIGVAVVSLATWRRTGSTEALRRVGIAGIACVVPLLGVIAATTGVPGFVRSLETGLSVLNFGNTIGTLPAKTLKDLYYSSPLIWITVTALFCIAATCGTYPPGKPPGALRFLLHVLLALNVLFLLWNVAYGIHIGAAPWVQLGIACLCLVCVQIGYVLTTASGTALVRATAGPVAVLCLLPFALAFGSAISIMPQTGMSLFAPFTASFVVAKLFAPPRGGRVVQAILFVAVPSIILWSSFVPHNLAAPLYRQSVAIRVPWSADTIRVDPLSAQYITALRGVAAREGLTPDTPVVDLSGGGPGTVLALGGRAPFYPWIFQTIGQPGPLVEATWASLSPDQKSRAWIIGPIDPAFAATQAVVDIRGRSSAYRRVADLVMPKRSGNQEIAIWRPRAR